jgi:hypothetical protein
MVADPAAARRQVADIELRRRKVAAPSLLPPASAFIDLGAFTTAPTARSPAISCGSPAAATRPQTLRPRPVQPRRAPLRDPGVYIAADGIATLESLRADRRTRRLTAVRTGRVPSSTPQRSSPTAHRAHARTLARELHPDAAG